MRRKVLQSFANTLCQMFSGDRVESDLEALAQLGDGVLEIDALTGEVELDGEPFRTLHISREISGWFDHALEAEHISRADLKQAKLTVEFSHRWRQDPMLKRQVRDLLVKCRTNIETDEAQYAGADEAVR